MKRITTTLLLAAAFVFTAQAQEVLKHKWHRFYIGGNKGYFVKTTQFTNTTMTENQFGAGNSFDNSPMEIKVAEIYKTDVDERVITDYGDSSYYVLVFKKFTANKAQGCMNTEAFKTIEEAKAFEPADTDFTDWFTEPGYKAEAKKPAMPEMTKKDALAFATFITKAYTDIKTAAEANSDGDKAKDGFAAAMLLAVMPSKYAELKGYNAYKSLPVIERGMKKFEKDADVRKIFKDAGLGEVK